MAAMKHILLTNDDGYQAEGLRALAAALEGFATVSIVAPSFGAQRGSAVVDAAAADRVQPDRGAGMGHRRDAGGLRDRGAAQTFAGKAGHGDFRD